MKIGRFAESNGLSIDTIRHYMDLGLILPEKQGGQYTFDSRCQGDLEEIIELKSMGFSLNEIKTIFFYKSFGKLAPYEQDTYYRTIFEDRYKKLESEIEKLVVTKDKLKHKLNSLLENSSKQGIKLGIGLKNLGIFRCLKCGGELILGNGEINDNQIIEGRLKCRCGEEYPIEEGILKSGTSPEFHKMSLDPNYLAEYINLTDELYLEKLHKSLEWGRRKLASSYLNGKVLLELGSGIGFFLRNVYGELPEDCLYIAVDHNIERHKFLKSLLERVECSKNIIFVCSDFLQIPIKQRSVDIVLDISGTSNYSFEHEEFLLGLIDSYVKDKALLLGTYITFKNFTSNSLIEKKTRKNFIMKDIKDNIAKLRYEMIEEQVSDYTEKGGRYENYFVEGEKVYSYSFFGKR